MAIIDCHTHLLPDDLLKAATDNWRRECWPVRYEGDARLLSETLLSEGVDWFALMPYASLAGQARELNRWSAEFARGQPGAIALGTFHPADADLDALVEEAFVTLRLVGADLHCQAGRFYPDDARLYPLFERAIALDRVIVFHAGRAPVRSRFVGLGAFYNVMRRFPRLKAVVAHLGADETEGFLDLAALFDDLYLDTSFVFDDLVHPRPRLERVLEFQDRLIYASGFPFLPHSPNRGLTTLRSLSLGAEIEEKLFFTNAARVLNMRVEVGLSG